MSNVSLIANMRSTLAAHRRGEASLRHVGKSLTVTGEALEALPYALVREFTDLGLDFEIAQYFVDDDFEPDCDELLQNTDALLSKVESLQA